jgi:hypothetical protein
MNKNNNANNIPRSFDGSAAKLVSGGLPLSGSEEPFTNFVYGGERWGKRNNNCYGFALDWFKSSENRKLQPGELSKTLKPYDDLTDPAVLKKKVISDLDTKTNGGYVSSPCVKCKKNYYKIMAFVDKGNDYHWYRQMGDVLIESDGQKNVNSLVKNIGVNRNQLNSPTDKPAKGDPILIRAAGLWAHKRGLSELTVLDSAGKFIKDPRDANRKYENLDYKTYVGTFCVNANFGKGKSFACN